MSDFLHATSDYPLPIEWGEGKREVSLALGEGSSEAIPSRLDLESSRPTILAAPTNTGDATSADLNLSQPSEPADAPLSQDPSSNATDHLKGVRILLADDDPAIRMLCSRHLTKLGYRVQVCANGEEAWANINKNPGACDLLIADNEMPGGTGAELIHRIRSVRWPLKIISISGSLDESQTSLAAALRIDAVLAKPFSFAALEETIRAVMTNPGRTGFGTESGCEQ